MAVVKPEKPYLESERLLFLQPSNADRPFIKALMENRKLTNHPGDLPTKDKIDSVVQQIIGDWNLHPFGTCIIKLRESGIAIGLGGVKQKSLNGEPVIDLGMMFLANYQKSGFGLESFKALLEQGFIFHNFNRIIANTTPDNIGAHRLLSTLNFKPLKELDIRFDDADYWGLNRDSYKLKKLL